MLGYKIHTDEHSKLLLCKDPTENCRLLNCLDCPTIEDVQPMIFKEFSDRDIDKVTYKAWVNTDRANFTTTTESSEVFAEKYTVDLNNYIRHDFIARSQSRSFDDAKKNLSSDTILVQLDFSENHTLITQNSIQSDYFNKRQITVHPVVLYYNENGKLQHQSIVYLSDVLEHNSKFVRALQINLMQHIKSKFPFVKLILYWSDGCAAQYKNKVLLELI